MANIQRFVRLYIWILYSFSSEDGFTLYNLPLTKCQRNIVLVLFVCVSFSPLWVTDRKRRMERNSTKLFVLL
jgi:hypothetical protein